MGDRVVTVAAGRLVWGYYPAGRLTACTVTRTEGVWTLAGTVVESDAYRLSQQPLAFVVPLANGSWRWPIESLQMTDGTLHARLGPME